MSQTYWFEFPGTKEMFLEKLNQYSNNDHKFFYFNDYIVEVSDNSINFGVQRGGHSGGYWFKPTITEMDNKLVFSGKIAYISSYTKNSKSYKAIEKIEEFFLFVFLFPIIFVYKVYSFIKFLVRKIRKQPPVKEETTEDRLYYLMENLLECTHK